MDRPELPAPRGPLSTAVIGFLLGGPLGSDDIAADPWGEDLHLALYCCYELHYRGFAGVSDECEWDPELLGLRRRLEQGFLTALRAEVPAADGTELGDVLAGLLVEPVDADGVSHHLRRDGERWQVREYVAHRSLYHLKEADPQAWVIPRLDGAAKAALVTVEHDEYGAGDASRMHAHLFAEMMRALDLDPGYGVYLDAAPAEVLAEVNLMSLCGLHRSLRGALVGQFAAVELTSSPGSDRLVRAMRRLDLPEAAVAFYAEHVEADAVHEQLVRRQVIAPLVAAEPGLAADVVFGIRAATLLADRTDAMLLDGWRRGGPTLRRPLPDAPGSTSDTAAPGALL
jgi:hypothetical protein